MQTVHGVLIDDCGIEEARRLFGNEKCGDAVVATNSDGTFQLAIKICNDPAVFLESLTLGEINADFVLVDWDFSKLGSASVTRTMQLADPPSSTTDNFGGAILRTLKRIDPDLPVLVLTEIDNPAVSFQAGQFGADEFFGKAPLKREQGSVVSP